MPLILTINSTPPIPILENTNHFLPKSLRLDPRRQASLPSGMRGGGGGGTGLNYPQIFSVIPGLGRLFSVGETFFLLFYRFFSIL